MSASNYAICPRCKDRRRVAAADAAEQVASAYGVVSIANFDALRAKAERLAAAVEADTNDTRTFREDYEFYGIEDGEQVTATYSGGCNTCGLSVRFEHSHPVAS